MSHYRAYPWDWPFWRYAWNWIGFVSNCTMGLLFEYYYFLHWRLRSLAGNWVKMCPQKQRHGTIRQNNIDPVLSATSEWPILIQVVENMDQIWKGTGSLWQCKPGHLIAFPGTNEEVWTLFYLAYLQVIGVPDQRLGEEICAWIKWDIPFLYIMTLEFALIPSVEGYRKKWCFPTRWSKARSAQRLAGYTKGLFTWSWGTPGRWGNMWRVTPPIM